MDKLNLISIDHFKKGYYKALLPLPKINDFLKQFTSQEVENATKTLIALFDTTLTKTILNNLTTTEKKQEFLRLAQDDYSSPTILDFLTDEFPGSETLIRQTLERTLLSAKSATL